MPEILRVVNDYIGVHEGYLGDFSYRTHAEFYPYYCELEIDPNQYPGTTRERFIAILRRASPEDQARILRGVLSKYPLTDSAGERTRSAHSQILEMIARLDGASPVTSVRTHITSAVVERAIGDAETLIRTSGATSGVDRIHTALHGYLIAACDSAGIPHATDATLNQLFRALRERHPNLQDLGSRANDISQVMRTFISVLDVLNPVRNQASVAHPNPILLDEPEAMLVINASRTILHYLDAKLRR